jgi:agmatinase
MPVYPIWENGKLTFKISRHCPLVCRGALPENFIKAAKAAWSAVKLPRWWQDAYSLVIREELPKDFNRTVDFALLGLCWDKTQSFRSGSAASPKLLRNMFVYIEPFFGDVDIEKQVTLEDLGDIEPASYEELLAQTAARLKTEKIPLLLGGEHSITLAGVRAIKPKVIVSLDAHPDVYTHPYIDEVWIKHKRSEIGHDCVMRHIAEDGYKIIFYGTRARSADEAAWMKGRGIRPATLEDLRAIKEPVYLSIDFDVLDPSIIPIVGNPEPDGLSFGQVIQAVRALARNIIAVDFVELTPLGSSADKIYIHLAAKLIYAVMAEIVRAQGRG